MDITIKIDQMLATKFAQTGVKVTRQDLAAIVFAQDKTREKTRIHYLSRWSMGQAIEQLKAIHLIRMSEYFEVPMEDLIEKD